MQAGCWNPVPSIQMCSFCEKEKEMPQLFVHTQRGGCWFLLPLCYLPIWGVLFSKSAEVVVEEAIEILSIFFILGPWIISWWWIIWKKVVWFIVGAIRGQDHKNLFEGTWKFISPNFWDSQVCASLLAWKDTWQSELKVRRWRPHSNRTPGVRLVRRASSVRVVGRNTVLLLPVCPKSREITDFDQQQKLGVTGFRVN